MQRYDFDRVIDRTMTDSYKWDMREKLFGHEDVLPMWVADMDFSAPPEVIEALKNRAEHGVFGYSIPTHRYHDAFIGWVEERHKWSVKREWVFNSPGVVPSIAIAIETFTDPGDKILIHSPVYYPFFEVIRTNGRKCVVSELLEEDKQYKIDFDDMEQKLATGVKALLLCSPHNPAGRVWTKAELERMQQLCAQYDVLVLSDEIHADLVFEPYEHIPYARLGDDAASRSITFMAPSKTFNLAGLHHSLTIIPDDEKRRKMIRAMRRYSLTSINNFSLVAAETAYLYSKGWLDALLHYIGENMQLALHTFAELKGVTAFKPEATYLLWLDFRETGLSHEQLLHWMKHEAKVGLNDGKTFGPGGEGFLRMNVACPRSVLEKGLERIREGLMKL